MIGLKKHFVHHTDLKGAYKLHGLDKEAIV